VYFSVLEALQNVSKYANAEHADVRLSESDGALRFEVEDDGDGFDAATAGRGTGLQGIADRLAALEGTVEVRSRPGAGTTVAGTIPLAGAEPASRAGDGRRRERDAGEGATGAAGPWAIFAGFSSPRRSAHTWSPSWVSRSRNRYRRSSPSRCSASSAR
jgi:hypothetical protein